MIMRAGIALGFVAALQVFTVQSRAAEGQSDFAAALSAKYALVTKAYETGDASLFRKFYAENAVVFGENQPAIVGIDALLRAWSEILPSRKTARVDARITYMSTDATLGVSVALLHAVKKDAAAAPVDETILTVWRRHGADWRCESEVFVKGDRVAEFQQR